jgi:ribosomal-protein-serine acetyltransferase
MTEFRIDENIRLRSFQAGDAAELFAAVEKNYGHLRPFLHWVDPGYSLESARQFIAHAEKEAAGNESRSFGIFFRGKLVGSIGFVNFNWPNRRAEIGYWIDKDFEGRGIIVRSCRALIEYAFDELDMNRIEIRCATENARSRAVSERLGFTLEGVLREAEWRHTRFFDMAVYGLLKEDWIKNKVDVKSVGFSDEETARRSPNSDH